MAPEVGEVPHANNHKREPLGRIIHKLRNIVRRGKGLLHYMFLFQITYAFIHLSLQSDVNS